MITVHYCRFLQYFNERVWISLLPLSFLYKTINLYARTKKSLKVLPDYLGLWTQEPVRVCRLSHLGLREPVRVYSFSQNSMRERLSCLKLLSFLLREHLRVYLLSHSHFKRDFKALFALSYILWGWGGGR